MKEDIVSYELAIKLKEMGFDLECYDFYTEDVKVPLSEIKPFPKPKNWNDIVISGVPKISCPRLGQAQAWLREVKGIHIAVDPYCKESNSDTNICNAEDCFWSMELSSVPFGYWLNVNKGEFDSYESALSAGIDKALELLTDKTTDK